MTKQMELQVLVRAHRALPCLSRHLGLRLVLNLTVGPFSFFSFLLFFGVGSAFTSGAGADAGEASLGISGLACLLLTSTSLSLSLDDETSVRAFLFLDLRLLIASGGG